MFPLISGTRAKSPKDDLTAESPILLDPLNDDPEHFIRYEFEETIGLSKPVGLGERGRRTIEIVGLNRQHLNSERGERISHLSAFCDCYEVTKGLSKASIAALAALAAERIRDMTRSYRPFAGACRAFVRDRGLDELIAND